MHCYSGSMELAKEFIKIGYKIAFGGVLTFKNSKESKETIKNINLKDIVFETDAPYLAPTPYRGKLNEPKFIKNTVEFASELLNIECKELERITYENSCKILHVENNEKVKIDDLIVLGIVQIYYPDKVYFFMRRWQFQNAELSDEGRTVTIIGGVILCIIGIGMMSGLILYLFR